MDLNEEKLIIEVQSRPTLYDKTLSCYKNINKREDLWKEVATALESDVNLCKKRWRSLRDGFIKNYRLSKTSASGAAGGRKKPWPFYSQLEFLIPHVEFRESTGNYHPNESPKEIPEQDVENMLEVEHNTEIEQPQTQLNRTVNFKRTKRTIDSTEEKLLQVVLEKSDPDESFLMSLLPSLKRLNPRKNAAARIKLQQVLYDIEFTEESSSCRNCANSSPPTPASVSFKNGNMSRTSTATSFTSDIDEARTSFYRRPSSTPTYLSTDNNQQSLYYQCHSSLPASPGVEEYSGP